MSSKTKAMICSAFKMNGYHLRGDASNHLAGLFASVNEVQREDCIDKILEALQKQDLQSSIIELEVLENAIRSIGSEEKNEETLVVIDAFSVPKYVYNCEKKKFLKTTERSELNMSLFGSANDKAELFRNRYRLLLQRTCRHKLFTPPIPGQDEINAKKFQLRNIEYLLGCTSKLKDIIVLGMITQLKEAKFFLEDLTGVVELDVREAKFHTGLFTENSFVLAEGWYDDEVFHVTAFGFPPLENAKTTRAYYGNLNFFGGSSNLCAKASLKLKEVEQKNEDAMCVFLSDVWLDKEKVTKKLEALFFGFQDIPPVFFVFCGPFCSYPHGQAHGSVLKEGFANLSRVIIRFPNLCQNSKFIFVPSSEDLGFGQILPRPPLPQFIIDDFTKKIPNAIFTTNPCRIQYCTQEIVVFRENMLKKMCRNSLRCPTTDLSSHFVKTLLSQGHLSPLPLNVSPVYWTHDHALQLYPVPDLIVMCDRFTEPFEIPLVDCLSINPGSFSCNDFNFKVYYPSTKTVDDSKVEE